MHHRAAMTDTPPAFRFRSFERQPQQLGVMWTLEKSGRAIACELWTHPLEWELRATKAGELMKSETVRTETAALELADEWRVHAESQGWHRPG